MREKPRSLIRSTASRTEAVAGSMVTSTRGTMISRTVVSPRSKILSIISASWLVTSASPGSIASNAFSSSRETKWRVPGGVAPSRRSSPPTTPLENATKGASRTEDQVNAR